MRPIPAEMASEEQQRRAWVVPAILLLLLVLGGWYAYRAFTSVQGVKVEAPPATAINMLPPPPPPPPPPPKPPEPTPVKATEPSPAPAPTPSPAAPAPMTQNSAPTAGATGGLSAGSGGGSGAPGGTGTCTSNCGNGGGGPDDGFYARYLSDALQEQVQNNDKVNRQVFAADFAIWISPAGKVTKAELVHGSGDPRRDAILQATLEDIDDLDVPPGSFHFPQRIKVKGRKSL